MSTLTVGQDGPGWLAGSETQSPVDRETLWYDYALGDSHPEAAPWVRRGAQGDPAQPEEEVAADLLARAGEYRRFPRGAWTGLRSASFPHGTAHCGDLRDLAAVATAPVRRDPSDPYNDHRGYASARCLFPVRALVGVHDRWQLVDPTRRVLVDTGAGSGGDGIQLTGRFSRIPTSYGWFAGSLIGLEIGILLRHLGALGRVLGHELTMHPPAPEPVDEQPIWRAPHDYAPAVQLRPAPSAGEALLEPLRSVPVAARPHLEDALADAAQTYRAHRFSSGQALLPSGIPAHAPAADADWSSVLWRRSAGRMPRGLWGFRVSERLLERSDVDALSAWAVEPGPASWRELESFVQIRLIAQRVSGLRAGVYSVQPDGSLLADRTVPHDAATRAADSYLYASNESSANDLHRAPAFFILTARPRALVEAIGPAGWSAMQHALGWITHGISLAAAGRDLLARPVRAFDERRLSAALALDPDTMPGLGVVVGHHQPHGGPQIDLRS